MERLQAAAAQLVRLNVAVIFASGPQAMRAARGASSSIPIVAYDLETDPVRAGYVQTLARPGGNLTGVFLDGPMIAGKWLQLIQEAVPGRQLTGILWDSTTCDSQFAPYIDKILRGAKAGDLAIQQPNRFEFALNAKVAKELGLTLPQSLVVRADAVIS